MASAPHGDQLGVASVQLGIASEANAALEVEVVDFSRGGFVMGHISEVAPGRFMLVAPGRLSGR